MSENYLTVKEFSRKAGVSVQSLYQRLETTLKPYLKIVKGKKYIETRALKEIYNIDLEQDTKQEYQDIKQENKQEYQEIKQDIKEDIKTYTDTLKLLQDTLDTLKEQLKQKDEQIKELNKALDQEQKLHAMTQQKVLELEEKKADVEEPPQKKEPKVSIWKKIFNN